MSPWENETDPLGPPDGAAPSALSAENLQAIETRASAYTDTALAGLIAAPPWRASTGPGNVVLGDSGNNPIIPNPNGTGGAGAFGRYEARLAPTSGSLVVLGTPSPGAIGTGFNIRLLQGVGGGVQAAFASSPTVIDRGAMLSVDLAPHGDTWIAMEAALDDQSGTPIWIALPVTSAVQNALLGQCKVIASTAVALSGLQTINGYALQDGDPLLRAAGSSVDNGRWIAHAGAWTRPPDYQAGASITGAIVTISASDGSYPGTQWALDQSTGALVIDTDATSWARVGDTAANLFGVADAGLSRSNLGVGLYAYARCVAATSISAGGVPSGLQTIDGLPLTDGDVCLCIFQGGAAANANNGPWIAHAGTWTRPTDWASNRHGSLIATSNMSFGAVHTNEIYMRAQTLTEQWVKVSA